MSIRFFKEGNTEYYEALRNSYMGKPIVEVNVVDDQIRNAFPVEYAQYMQSKPGEIETIPDGPILRGIH